NIETRTRNERLHMKPKWIVLITGCAAMVLCLMTSLVARGADAAKALSTFSGDVAGVHAAERSMAVKGFWSTRNFQLADGCEFQAGGKKVDSIAAFRPGQRVQVCYENASGVLVARKILQEDRVFTGTVKELKADTHQLTVAHGIASRHFEIAGDCRVVLKDDKTGRLEDLKPGHLVRVIYEEPGKAPVTHQIEQRSASDTGTLTAIDGSARTLKAQRGLSERKFSLADNSKIVINGKLGGSLTDLRLGEKVTLNYDDVDGVLVVNRVARDESSAGPAAGSAPNHPPH